MIADASLWIGSHRLPLIQQTFCGTDGDSDDEYPGEDEKTDQQDSGQSVVSHYWSGPDGLVVPWEMFCTFTAVSCTPMEAA